jgi:signal transduction histidine kinase
LFVNGFILVRYKMANTVHKEDRDRCPSVGTYLDSTCIYADILEHIDLGIIVLDTAEEEVAIKNKAAQGIFADLRGNMDYTTISTLLMQDMGEGLISDGFGKPQTLHYKNKLLGYTAYVIPEHYIGVLIRDITESARLESIAEAVNTMENITYIFSGIRHELGNPINSIKMTLSVLRKNLNRYSMDIVQNYVDRTLAEITRVEYLLKSLKSFSMFENPSIQDVDLAEFLDLFQTLVAGDLEKNGIKISTLVSPEAQWVRADPRALQQVMLNLIANAADALNGKNNPTIFINTQKKDDFIWVTVHDNGVGIPPDNQQHLFKPFYTTKPHGTGLGLAIAKKLLAKMSCRIGIVSHEDVGTTATISIPEGRREDA